MEVTCMTRTTYEVVLNNDDIVVMDFISKEIEISPPDMMCVVIEKFMHKMSADFLEDSKIGT